MKKKNIYIFKFSQNSKCDKLKFGNNYIAHIVTKLKKSYSYKTLKLKFGQNQEIQIGTKLKKSNHDQTLKLKFYRQLKNSIFQVAKKKKKIKL